MEGREGGTGCCQCQCCLFCFREFVGPPIPDVKAASIIAGNCLTLSLSCSPWVFPLFVDFLTQHPSTGSKIKSIWAILWIEEILHHFVPLGSQYLQCFMSTNIRQHRCKISSIHGMVTCFSLAFARWWSTWKLSSRRCCFGLRAVLHFAFLLQVVPVFVGFPICRNSVSKMQQPGLSLRTVFRVKHVVRTPHFFAMESWVMII